MHDLIHSLAVSQLIPPQRIAVATIASQTVDMQGAESLMLVVGVSSFADALDADCRVDYQLQHADDDGTGQPGAFADCTDADIDGFAGLNGGVFLKVDDADKALKSYKLAYIGVKRFVKVIVAPHALTTGGYTNVLAVKGNLAQRPQA